MDDNNLYETLYDNWEIMLDSSKSEQERFDAWLKYARARLRVSLIVELKRMKYAKRPGHNARAI